MSVWYCNSGILVHVLCNAEKEFGEYGGLVHMADVKINGFQSNSKQIV